MRALVLNALGRGFDFEEVEIAAPIGRELLVDVHASGLCHTDLLFATHDITPTSSVLGHEVAGIVAAVGPDVTQVHVGDRVVGSLPPRPDEPGRSRVETDRMAPSQRRLRGAQGRVAQSRGCHVVLTVLARQGDAR